MLQPLEQPLKQIVMPKQNNRCIKMIILCIIRCTKKIINLLKEPNTFLYSNIHLFLFHQFILLSSLFSVFCFFWGGLLLLVWSLVLIFVRRAVVFLFFS